MTTVGNLTFNLDSNRARLDQQLQQIRAEALKQPLQYKIVVDEAASRRSLDAALKGLSGKEAKIKLSLDGQAIQAELTRLKALQTVTITVKMSGKQDIQNDVNTLKTLLGELRGNMQYRVTVNTTALSALNNEIHTQIVQLQSLITQLRSLGNGPRPGPSGGAGGPSVSAANRALLSELEALNNQWKRGDIAAADFSRELTALQARISTAAAAATAGSAEFRALDAGLTRLTGSLRGVNTDAFQKLRTEAAAMRLAFDTATAGVPRNSAAFQAAVTTYNAASTSLQARLQALVASGQLTTQQLGQVNREMARLGREAQSVAGGVNAAGFSGNIVNALRSVLPMLSQTGGALGAAAGQASMFGGGVMSAAAALGPFGIAVGVTTVAVALLTAGIGAAVNEYALFERQMQGVKAVSDASGESFDALKTQAKDLALAYGQNVVEIGAVQEELFKAGRSIEDVLGGAAKAVTVLMQATGSDLTNAVKIAGSAMNTFGIKGQDMMRVSDAIANGANKTALDVHTLGIALQQVGNGASTAGMSLEETVAVLGLLADRGIQGSDAGTSLKVMLQRLTAGMPDVIAELKKYNVSVFDGTGAQRDMMTVLGDVIKVMDRMTDEQRGAFLQTVAGSDAQRVLAASYRAGTSSLKDYVAMMDDTGRAEKDAKTRAEGLIGAKNRLNTSIQVFKDNIGAIFAPAMTQMYEGLKGAVDQATRLAELLGKISGTGPKIEFTDMQKELNAARDQLARERSNLASLTRTAEAQKRVTGSVSDPIQDRLTAAQRSVAALESQVKVLELQVRTEAVAGGTFVGPVMPGQNQDGTQVVFNPKSTDALGAQVISAAAGKLGDVSADSIVDYCAKWVRLTLGKASPETASQINKLFQTDSNGDGQVTATDAARNALKAGFAQRYSGVQDLKPGDVVFYTEGGQNHTGVYIGNGMVRGNNRVTYAQNGGKFDQWGNPTSPGVNPVGDVAINKLGTPNWFMRPGEVLTQMGAKPAKVTGAGGSGGAGDDGAITSAQIAKAQALVQALEAAKKARDPKAIDAAALALKKWTDAADSNARAVSAVQAAESGLTKTKGEYVATQKDLNQLGATALKLLKEQEAAQKSGNAARILAADNAVKAWQTDKKLSEDQKAARVAVMQVEQAAYQSRKQASEEAKRDAERDAKDAERRAKEAQQRAAAINEALRTGKIESARLELGQLEAMRENDLRNAGDNALAVATVERRYAELTYNAKKAVAQKEKADRDADIRNDPNLNATARTQALQNSTRAYNNAVAAAGNERAAAFKRAEDVLNAAAVESAGRLPQAMAGWIGEWAADQAVSRAAATENARVANLIIDGAIDELKKRAAQSKAELEEIMTDLYVRALEAGINPDDRTRPDEYRSNEPKTKSKLAALIGDPAGFLAAWEAMGEDAALPALMADQYGPEDWRGLGADVLQGLADGMRGKEAWVGIAQIVDAALGEVLEDAALKADVAAMVTARNDQYGMPTPFSTGNERGEGGGSELSRTVARKNALELYAGTLRDMNAAQLDAAESAAIAADNTDHYNAVLAERERRLKADKEAAEAAAKAARELAEAIAKTQADAIAQAVKDTADLKAAEEKLYSSQRALDTAMGKRQQPYADEIRGLEELRAEIVGKGGSVEAIDAQIAAFERLQKIQGAADVFSAYAGYARDLAGALGGLAEASGNSDLAANLNGAANLAGKLIALAGDVARIVANPADIGAWVGAITKVIGGISEAIGGFQKAHAEAKRLREDFNGQFTFINGDNFAKSFVRSRGWLADTFGGGPEVKQEIDKIGLMFAKSLEGGFVNGIKGGLKESLAKNDFTLFSKTLKESVYDGILEGIVDAFINGELLKGIIAPAIKAWSDALKTADTSDDAAALAGIDAAIGQVDNLANRFFSDVAPKLGTIRDKWGIGSDGQVSGPDNGVMFGSTPGASLGLARVELTLPPIFTAAMDTFSGAAPVFAEGSSTLLRAARLIEDAFKTNGPPRLSGNGGLT